MKAQSHVCSGRAALSSARRTTHWKSETIVGTARRRAGDSAALPRTALVARIFCLALLWVGVVAPAFAHDPGLSTASVRLGRDRLEATVTLSIKDAASLVSLDENRDGRLALDEIATGERRLLVIGPDALEVTLDDRITVLRAVHCRLDGNSNATVQLEVPVKPFSTVRIRSKWLTQLPPGHRQFLSLHDSDDRVLTRKLLSIDSDATAITLNPSRAQTSDLAAKRRWAIRFIVVAVSFSGCWLIRHLCCAKKKASATVFA